LSRLGDQLSSISALDSVNTDSDATRSSQSQSTLVSSDKHRPAIRGKVQLIVDEVAVHNNSVLQTPAHKAPSIQLDTAAYDLKGKELSVQVLDQDSPEEDQLTPTSVKSEVKAPPPKPTSKTLELIKKITSQATGEEDESTKQKRI
jgi:hypothetical protein